MRNLIIALLLVLFSISTASADYSYCYKVSNSGVAIACDELSKEVYANSLAVPFSDSFKEAMDLKGDTLLVKISKNIIGRSSLIENSFLLKNEYIYYDSVFNNINYFPVEHKVEKVSFAYIWILIAIGLMLISNILFLIYKKKKNKDTSLSFYAFVTSSISCLSACFGIFVTLSSNFVTTPLIVALVAIIASATAFAVLYDSNKKYIISSVLFYFITILFMIYM